MERRTIIDFLNDQARGAADGTQHISFHMPGHKGRPDLFRRAGYGDILREIIACDITEIPGADALFCPETTLRSVMENYAELYGVRKTELLVNGSSAGVMAAVMASVPPGGKLILGRNSHHSAFSALRLGDIDPVYVRPETDAEYGVTSCITPEALEQACEDAPDASAVLITSPNYCGIMSDIAALAATAHEHGMLLIVDQAHGSHLRFFDNEALEMRADGDFIPHPRHSAESLGADIVINSTHKTLLSFTGSGILNICSDMADAEGVSGMLRMLQTTSPSYLLMGSLDMNEKIMRAYGAELIAAWREDLTKFYRRAARIPGITLIGADNAGGSSAPLRNTPGFMMYDYQAGLDPTKINISMAALGITGDRLEAELRQRGIIAEMVHGEFVMLMTGAGNVSGDYDALLAALESISSDYGSWSTIRRQPVSDVWPELETAVVPRAYEEVPLYQSDRRVLYDPVIIYPPGTPVVCPGEVMSLEAISCIAAAIERGEKVTGVSDEGTVRVDIE